MCFAVAQEPVEVKCCTPALTKPGVKGSIGLKTNMPQPVYHSMINSEMKGQTVKDPFTENLMVSHGEVSSCREDIFTVHWGSQPNNSDANTNNRHIILVFRLIQKYCKRQRNTT